MDQVPATKTQSSPADRVLASTWL